MQNFGRGEISSFLMKCPEEIGTPVSLQIWHDNTGGNQAGWYLGKVVLIDLKQKQWLEAASLYCKAVAVLGLGRVGHGLPTQPTGLPTKSCGLP